MTDRGGSSPAGIAWKRLQEAPQGLCGSPEKVATVVELERLALANQPLERAHVRLGRAHVR